MPVTLYMLRCHEAREDGKNPWNRFESPDRKTVLGKNQNEMFQEESNKDRPLINISLITYRGVTFTAKAINDFETTVLVP